jgi:hypothetical protein
MNSPAARDTPPERIIIHATFERQLFVQQAEPASGRDFGMTHSPNGPSTIAMSMQHTMLLSAMTAAQMV